MGSPALATTRAEGTINKHNNMKVFVALAFVFAVAGAGYIRPHCTKALEKITVKKCRLEYTEECSTATKEIGQRISYEKGECKEIEVCKPVHFVPKYGLRPHYGKREAEAKAGYAPHVECEKTTKEVCKQVPVKTPVEKEFETCTRVPKEVCEDVETSAPKVTCESLKH